jgi:hypothetical protein
LWILTSSTIFLNFRRCLTCLFFISITVKSSLTLSIHL